MSKSLSLALCLLVLALGLASLTPGADAPHVVADAPHVVAAGESDFTRAEALFAEGSYALAREQYEALEKSSLSEADARWVEFRLADCGWRAAAASQSSDTTDLDQARLKLETLLREATRQEQRDRTWVEAQESLGDYWWTRRNSRNWYQAWNYYQQALDWWAGSREIDLARERYLDIVWTSARPPRAEPYYYYGYHGNQLPLDVLENALRISDNPAERAHASYLIAMTLRYQGGNERTHRRTVDAFQAALAEGRASEWYDDALFQYAEWLAGSGTWVRAPQGPRSEPDFVGAVEIYQRLLREFEKGETRYHDQARDRIRNITSPSLAVAVSNIFLPGSEVQYHLRWRNLAEVQLSLHEVDLPTQVNFTSNNDRSAWLANLDLEHGRLVDSWAHTTGDPGRHMPGQDSLTLGEAPRPGAYVLQAVAGGQSARDLVLVTQASVVLQTSPTKTLAYVCDALDGSPLAGAEMALWVGIHRNSRWNWERHDARTDRDGLVDFDLPSDGGSRQIFAVARHEDHQAFAMGENWHHSPDSDAWRIYVFTDRPAYRPDEVVQWKTVARVVDPQGQYGSRYVTPAGQVVQYEVYDPRGTKIDEGELRLNDFGSAWSELELASELPLGEYRVTFRDAGNHIGGAVLFRMEEYKLPEFEVSVETPQDDGRPRIFRIGETVESEVLARYYFGGPVANATVQVVVYQKPLYVQWRPTRTFPWFFEDIDSQSRHHWYGQGQVVHQETLRTDAEGRATVSFETPAGSGQDFEYTLEARVTDASRREVVGRGTVSVSRQRYFAFIDAAHNLHRPGDEVRLEITTVDANKRPLATEGLVSVTRERWIEVWLDPHGKEITAGASVPRGGPGWQLKSQGYEQEEVLSRLVRTGEDGTAEFAFTAGDEGYYRVRWSGDEQEPFPVHADTTIWIADRDTNQVGYHHGGVQILVDEETLRAGGSTPVMLSVPVSDSWVLFTVEAEELLEYRLVHVTGRVKLIELDVPQSWVPNVFLGAVMVRDGQMHVDSRQVVVPPVDNFLEVEVEADREAYQPGEKGTLWVTTRDHDGNPVSAEVALALVDESVFYIQQDYAGDPRKFFFGDKRPKRVRLQSSFQQKAYGKLVLDQKAVDGVRWDRDDLDSLEEARGMAAGAADMEFSRAEGEGGRKRMAQKSVVGFADEALAAAPMAKAKSEADAMPSSSQNVAAGSTVQVRSDFRSTALWVPGLVTGTDGRGSVEVTFPDSLTTWKATGRAVTTASQFGIGGSEMRTRMPLMARLQAPRFFVVGDELTISAVINNHTDVDQSVEVVLKAEGLVVTGVLLDGRATGSSTARVEVAARGETRVDWLVEVAEAGEAKLKVVARSDEFGDAMERSYTVYEHGVEKFLSRSGKARGDEVQVNIDLPRERRAGSTTMTVQVTPSLAVTMLDALPYLIDYPYGCTEQTMSRFLPAAITARTLAELGLKPKAIAGRIFGGIEQEHAARTHTRDKQDLERLNEMLRKGLKRLYDFQHGDGGWGWWKDGDSDHFMTAYVVWGMGIAAEAGIDVKRDVVRRAAEFLDRELVEAEERPDLQAWMLHALASLDAKSKHGWRTRFQLAAFENLWERRDALNAYTRALLALSTHYAGLDEQAQVLVRNLVNGVKRDDTPDTSVVMRGSQSSHDAVMGTAHWGEDGFYWRWSDGGVEATAFVLRALLTIEPGHELVEPTMNWLIRNRRGAQWSNTRDTAISLLTLTDYLRTSGELDSTLEYEISVNGHQVATKRVRPEEILGAPSRFEVDAAWLRDGVNEVVIRKLDGDGPLYFAVDAIFFSLEEPITAAGNEIFVRRQYFKLSATPTLLKGYEYEKVPLNDGEQIKSGERVEVVLTIEAKNNYEYLVFEDLKPAGLEAVQVRSGERLYAKELKRVAGSSSEERREGVDYTGRTRWIYQELRDRKVALFLDRLPEGIWEIRYELRAETPGSFHALPVLGHAMYVPEIRCNGAEVRIEVLD